MDKPCVEKMQHELRVLRKDLTTTVDRYGLRSPQTIPGQPSFGRKD